MEAHARAARTSSRAGSSADSCTGGDGETRAVAFPVPSQAPSTPLVSTTWLSTLP